MMLNDTVQITAFDHHLAVMNTIQNYQETPLPYLYQRTSLKLYYLHFVELI